MERLPSGHDAVKEIQVFLKTEKKSVNVYVHDLRYLTESFSYKIVVPNQFELFWVKLI